LQQGDEDLSQVSLRELRGADLVIEEKIDGSNCGLSFDQTGNLLIQSRGHYLCGGGGEAQFDLLKAWALSHRGDLWSVLGDRYVMYGEWVYAHHTIYYDALPHYFLEFDVLDRSNQSFLSTPARRAMLAPLGFVHSVPVLYEGHIARPSDLTDLVGPSLYRTAAWRDRLECEAAIHGVDPQRALAAADPSRLSEGLYIKHEQDGHAIGRYKFVRATFLQTVTAAGEHWKDRLLVRNWMVGGPDALWNA
jgi:hypothetical protein